MNALKTAIIGCGPRAYGHADAARRGQALTLVCACDIDTARADKAAAAWGVHTVHDAAEVFADREVEAVIIVTNVGTHIPLAKAALAAGKQVIVEKPLGDDIAAARDLVALAARSPQTVYVSYQLRFMPQMAAIHAAARDIAPVQVLFGRSRGMMKPQFLNPTPFCGIMDVCAHDFDMVSWFMGAAPVAVSAVLRRNTFTRDTGAADALSAVIDYGDGRSATIVSTIGAPEIGTKCDIAGAKGNISWGRDGKLSGMRFAEFQSEGVKTPLDLTCESGVNPDAALQKAFLAEVRSGVRSDAARPQDGLNSLLLTLACLKSAEEGRRVRLKEVQ